MLKVERVSSGIPGLDDMLSGGIPRGRVVLVVGGPGTGKTILCSQFLISGIRDQDEAGLFVTLDESREHIVREMASFGWNIPEYEKMGKWIFTDLSPISMASTGAKPARQTIGKKEFSLESVLDSIRTVARSRAKRIVLDTVTSLAFQYPDLVQRRSVLLEFIETLSSTGATSIMTTELRTSGLERSVQLEEYLAHGVVVLQTLQVGKSITRVLQVEKMRETPIDTQMRPYRITENGIEVYSRESIF
ncbi:MAG: ATPase domain-containing protein [Candidatus Bathyarchaeia archaeon]